MKKIQINPLRLMYLIFTIGFISFLISIIASKGSFLTNMVYSFSRFIDFFNHIFRFYLNLDTVYSEGMHASFPPLAYCMYYFISRILAYENALVPENISYSDSGLLIVSMMIALFALFFCFAFIKVFRETNLTLKKCLCFMLFLSYPFWLAIERGNMVLLVLILLMYAMYFMDSEVKYERELALILIAVSAGLKLYPAIFGLLYLVEKRYREAFRLFFYGLIFFFLPFAFFGGINGFFTFLNNITAVSSGATGVTIEGLTGRLMSGWGYSIAFGHSVGQVLSALYFLLVILLCLICKKSWKTIALLTSLMIVFVAASGNYCLIYWVIPLIGFMNDLRSRASFNAPFTKLDYLYAVLFSLVFFSYPIPALGASGILYIMLYILLTVIIIDLSLGTIKRIRTIRTPA